MYPTPAAPTQMIIFPIKEEAKIDDASTHEGQIWARVVEILQGWEGFYRLYWGRHVEEPEFTEIHIVRDTIHQHYSFLASKQWAEVARILAPICHDEPSSFVVRHAMISDFTPDAKSLGKGAPFTGTAIYLATDTDGWEKAWALWTTIVPNVQGCMGVTGGWMLEPVDGHPQCYIVYVGWETTELHDAYHHTKDFYRKSIVLQLHNKGWREYRHVSFKHSRSKREANL
ncbi:hypothetical protein FQN50_006336 [Emmonsiellopsis sp. PD_5]|nr:hypothetical protein FQN50_006336 [Emmonsiellopsis sp. PD_5]